MLKLPLLRAVLAAAALSLPASAQSDAAFASALGKLPSGLAAMAQLKTAPQAPAPAQVQGPAAPADVWKKVSNNALSYGEPARTEGSDLIAYKISEELVIKKGAHLLTQSLNFLVLPVGNGKFRAAGALFIVTEIVYTAETKQAVRESWVFEVSGSGRLTSAQHDVTTFTEIPNGKPTKTESPVEILALDAELTAKQFTAMLEYWSR